MFRDARTGTIRLELLDEEDPVYDFCQSLKYCSIVAEVVDHPLTLYNRFMDTCKISDKRDCVLEVYNIHQNHRTTKDHVEYR